MVTANIVKFYSNHFAKIVTLLAVLDAKLAGMHAEENTQVLVSSKEIVYVLKCNTVLC
mgnify:CR=1 FL=1